MDSKTRLLYWVLDATRGGPTRKRIIRALSKKPMNVRQLSLTLKFDYKTIQGHIELLLENGLIYTPNRGYGAVYFLSSDLDGNEYLKEVLRGNNDEKKRK